MATTTWTTEAVMATIHCGKCGGVYAITERHRKWCADCRGTWNCPYCQTGWGYSRHDALSEERRRAAQLRAELDREQTWHRQERERRAATERRLAAAKGQATKLKNRAGKGICPCCNRYFANVHRHMQSQHPEHAVEAREPAHD